MKEAHDIANIEEFRRGEKAKREKEMESKKVLQEITRTRLESQLTFGNNDPTTFEKGAMSRVFSSQPSTSATSTDENVTPVFQKSKHVQEDRQVSEYEKIRLANIKEKDEMFKQLEINQAKEVIILAVFNSTASN